MIKHSFMLAKSNCLTLITVIRKKGSCGEWIKTPFTRVLFMERPVGYISCVFWIDRGFSVNGSSVI